MGGLIILLATVVPTLLWAPLTNRFVVVAMLSILWMGCIGFLDDYLKIVQGKSRGLVAKWKLAGQVSFGLLLGLFLIFYPVVPPTRIPATATTLPFFKYLVVNFAPWLYVVFVTVVITGSSNAVNLTDGLDGLATGLAGIAAAAFADVRLPLRSGGRHHLPQPLLPARAPASWRSSAPRSWARPSASSGSTPIPPQVFMGDTGSLAIGGALGTVAILLKAEFLLLLIGGVFAAEAVSRAAPDRHVQVVQAHPGQGVRRRPPGLPHGAAAPPLREAGLGRDHGGDPVLHPRPLLRPGGALHAEGALR